MEISRRGTSVNYGEYSITLENPIIEWNKSKSGIILKKSGVRDFSSKSNHDYTIAFSSKELVQMFSEMAAAALSDPKSFEEQMGSALKNICQINAVLAGVVRS